MTMNLSFAPSELEIINILAQRGGSLRTLDIVLEYQKIRKNTPKQTVYRALGSLKKKEVISIVKGKTSINTHWAGYIRSFLDQLESKSKLAELPDKLSIVFPSLWSLAPTWTHYVNILLSQSDKGMPVVFINPHQWFYIAREWSEDQLVKNLKDNGYVLWQCITNNEKLDKEIIKSKFSGKTNQGAIISTLAKEKDLYINVIGDYIITVFMSEEFTREINNWYKINEDVNADNIQDLKGIIKNSGKVKIIIKKNKKKADSYRTHLSKFFYFPK